MEPGRDEGFENGILAVPRRSMALLLVLAGLARWRRNATCAGDLRAAP